MNNYSRQNDNNLFKGESSVKKYKTHFYANLLLEAIKEENLKEVKWLLIQMNADPNILFTEKGICFSSSMHMLASKENEYFSVEAMHLALRECNGDPNLRSLDGVTPVHLAAVRGRCRALELLLNFGGDPDLVEYKTFLNAEDLALREHQWAAHEVLTSFDMIKEHENCKTRKDMRKDSYRRKDENRTKYEDRSKDEDRRRDCKNKLALNQLRGIFSDPGTPERSSKFLVEEKSDSDRNSGLNPRNSLPTSYTKRQTKCVVSSPPKTFKGDSCRGSVPSQNERGSPYNDSSSCNKDEFYYANLLMKEIQDENLDKVKWLLLDKKADPNVLFSKKGISSMHLLAGMEKEGFSVEVMRLALRECNGDPNLRSEEGQTPVHVAAMRGRHRVLELMLESGGDPELIDFKTSLNAEDLALREHQWQAHATLVTHAIVNETESPESSKDTPGCNLVQKSACEHEVLLKKLRALFDDTETPSDESSVKKELYWKDEVNLGSPPASYEKNQTTAIQMPPVKNLVDDLHNSEKEVTKISVTERNSQEQSQKLNSQDRAAELSGFSGSRGSISKLKTDTKALVKTTAIKVSKSLQSLKVKTLDSDKKKGKK